MSALRFAVVGAKPKRYTALPAIAFALHVESEEPLDALVLRAQVRLDAQWRRYAGEEQVLLNDLFGEPERWGTTLRPIPWADVSLTIPGFERERDAEIDVTCTYDFDVAATRLLHALSGGEIPVSFLFSGAVFRRTSAGFWTERVSWSSDCSYRMPVEVWRAALREVYGDDALIRVNAQTLERLHQLRALSGATSWDALFERLTGAPT